MSEAVAEAAETVEAGPGEGPADAADRRLTRKDIRILVALTGIAFLLRLLSPIMPDFLTNPTAWPPVRALGLGHPYQPPNGYIFDEVYFAQDACKDLVGQDYLDPEPPLAKLVIAAGIVVGGTWMHYDRGVDVRPHKSTNASGQVVTTGGPCETAGTLPGFGTWGWRLTSLVFGTAIIPLMYVLARRLWNDRFFATSAAILMAFDGMTFVQSRIAMIDMVALFLLLLVYWLFHVHREARSSRAWWRSGLLLGLALGLAVSAKWTTLATLGTMLIFLVGGWVLRYIRIQGPGGWSLGQSNAGRVDIGPALSRVVAYVVLFGSIPLLVYGLSYFRYASIDHTVPLATRDLKCGNFDSSVVTARGVTLTRVGNNAVSVWVPTGVDFGRYATAVLEHDRWAYQYHASLCASHTYGSPWYSWPLLLRPVAYYYADNLGTSSPCQSNPPAPLATGASTHNCTLRAEVFNLGNPAIWWAAVPALIFCAVYAVRRRNYPAAFIVVAFLLAWLPFSRVTRVMFLYHMFGSLPLVMLALAFALAKLRAVVLRIKVGAIQLPAVTGTHLATAYLGLVLVMFVYFYPAWTALPLSGDAWQNRMWINVPHTCPQNAPPTCWYISWV
jgi:hypothetical protein